MVKAPNIWFDQHASEAWWKTDCIIVLLLENLGSAFCLKREVIWKQISRWRRRPKWSIPVVKLIRLITMLCFIRLWSWWEVSCSAQCARRYFLGPRLDYFVWTSSKALVSKCGALASFSFRTVKILFTIYNKTGCRVSGLWRSEATQEHVDLVHGYITC